VVGKRDSGMDILDFRNGAGSCTSPTRFKAVRRGNGVIESRNHARKSVATAIFMAVRWSLRNQPVPLDKAATTNDTRIPTTAIHTSSGRTHSAFALVLFIGPPFRRLRVLGRRASLGRHNDVHQTGLLPLQGEHP